MTHTMEDALKMARKLGQEAGHAAGTWAADGNTSVEHAERVLTMLREGDPMAWDYLPNYPTLSGEWAGDPTPQSLAWDCGMENATADEIDALCEAWADGVADKFEITCAIELETIVG